MRVLALVIAPILLATGHSIPETCLSGEGPEYYKIDLVPTKRVPAARRAVGAAHLSFTPSPFAVSVSPKGHYAYDLNIQIDNLGAAPGGVYVGWISTPSLGEIVRLGRLSRAGSVSGRVSWNKFLVIVTLEPYVEPGEERWRGPVVMRGMSRSGLMHTMAGHGPFQQEPCAVYGYN